MLVSSSSPPNSKSFLPRWMLGPCDDDYFCNSQPGCTPIVDPCDILDHSTRSSLRGPLDAGGCESSCTDDEGDTLERGGNGCSGFCGVKMEEG